MTDRPTPILYVHHRPELGGAPNSLLFLIKGLDRNRYQPFILCPEGEAAQLFRQAGVRVYPAPVSNFTHVVNSVYKGWRWLIFVRELLILPLHWLKLWLAIQDSRAKLVHLNECTLLASAFLSHWLGLAVVWHVRATLERGVRRKLIHQCMTNWANVVVAIDEDILLPIKNLPNAKVIHNSVDLEKFKPNQRGVEVRKSMTISEGLQCVALIGRVRKDKGVFDFIEAINLLPSELRMRSKFLVVGGSEYSTAYFNSFQGRLVQFLHIRKDYLTAAKKLVAEYNLQDNIVFLDFWDDMPSLYDAIDIVVFSSLFGGIGRPGFEASACGKPIIASSATNNSDVVINNVTGILVPPANPDKLASAISMLLENEKLRVQLGQAGLDHARHHFDLRINSRLVMDLYERILAL